MKKNIIYGLLAFLTACGPDRDFEDKNIFGSQTVGSASGSSSSSGDTTLAWPQDNMGYNVSNDLPVWLAWKGYLEGDPATSKLVHVTVDRWYDPDGGKGINAILFLTSKYNCAACAKETKDLQTKIESWDSGNKGIKVVVLVINNITSNGPPDPPAALQWKTQYGLKNATVVIDPVVTFAIDSSFATPLRTIVDPRTMKVFEVSEGYTDDYATLLALADNN